MVPINTEIARFKTTRRKQNLASALSKKRKIGGNHAFSEMTKLQYGKKKTPLIALYFTVF